MNDVVQGGAVDADKLDLGFMPIQSQELADDPMPFLEAARRKHPWLARCEAGYIVHAYDAMNDLMRMDDHMESPNHLINMMLGSEGTPWGHFLEKQIFGLSGEEHARVRASVAEAFTPRNVNRFRSLMRKTISDLLDEWAPKGRFDMADFASNFPVTIACALIGAPRDRIQSIREALEALGMAFALDPTKVKGLEDAYLHLFDFVSGLVKEREASGGGEEGDLLNTLIAAKREGQLNDQEICDLLVFLFVAGFDTSKNMLTLIMYTMLEEPEHWARCAEDMAFCSKLVDEQFRFRNVATSFRTVSADVVYRGVKLPKGTFLAFPLPLAGRDPSVFEDPDSFKPERAQEHRHMAFGRGMHMCLGQHLAKAQIDEGTHLIAQRVTKPKLAGKPAWRPFPGAWGLLTLPIEFTPAPRRPEPLAA
jgi:cytochrome P450